MSDPTRATGEAARGVDLDAIEHVAANALENGWDVNLDTPEPETVLALVDRVRSAEAARDAALARVKELEAGLRDVVGIAEALSADVPCTGTTYRAIEAARLLSGKDGADG